VKEVCRKEILMSIQKALKPLRAGQSMVLTRMA